MASPIRNRPEPRECPPASAEHAIAKLKEKKQCIAASILIQASYGQFPDMAEINYYRNLNDRINNIAKVHPALEYKK